MAAQWKALTREAMAIQSAVIQHLQRTCGHSCQVPLRRGCTVGGARALVLPILALLPFEGHAIPAEQSTEAGGKNAFSEGNAAPRQGNAAPRQVLVHIPVQRWVAHAAAAAAAALAQPSSAHHQSQKSACTEPLASSSIAPGMPSFRSGGGGQAVGGRGAGVSACIGAELFLLVSRCCCPECHGARQTGIIQPAHPCPPELRSPQNSRAGRWPRSGPLASSSSASAS